MGLEPGEAKLIEGARALAPVIRANREAIDRDRTLPAAIVDGLVETGVYRMYTPRELGGLEVKPWVLLEAIEALASVDGSTAWAATICGVQGLYISRLTEDAARTVTATSVHGVAGAFNPAGGRMKPVDGGYLLSGRWRFASGCNHAEWMMAPAIVFGDDGPLRTATGAVVTRVALVPKEFATIIDTWDVSGMRGTGSHDFELHDHFVAGEFTFAPTDPGLYPGPVYRLPIVVGFGPGVAAVCLGLAKGAVEELRRLATEKVPTGSRDVLAQRASAQLQVAEAEALRLSARAFMVQALHAVWDAALAGGEIPLETRLLQRTAAWNAARSSLRAIELCVDAAGTSAIYATSPLDRALRDIRVAAQHIAVGQPAQEAVGRALFGLDPGPLV